MIKMGLDNELEEDGSFYEDGEGVNPGLPAPADSIELGYRSSSKKRVAGKDGRSVGSLSDPEPQGDSLFSGMKDSNDGERRLERLYSRLGQVLYNKIQQRAGCLEIDNSLSGQIKKITALKKDFGRYELERRINRRFERLENRLQQLTNLICQRIPFKPEAPLTEKPAEPAQNIFPGWEDRFEKIEKVLETLLDSKSLPAASSGYPVQAPDGLTLGGGLSPEVSQGEKAEKKARAKARATARAEAKARMEARNRNRMEKEKGFPEVPAASKPVKTPKVNQEAIEKIRLSVKDLQNLVKSRENKILENRRELSDIALEVNNEPVTETVAPPVAVKRVAEQKKESALPETVKNGKLPTAGASYSDLPEDERKYPDFSRRRIDETKLFLELASQIPDSADRLSYIEFLRDLEGLSVTSRIAAAQSLITWPIPQTEIALISAWKKEKEARVRAQIIESLKTIESSRIMGVFREFQTKEDPRVQLMALEGFNRWGSEEGMKCIVEGLKSRHPMVRRRAVTYIGWSLYKKALPALVRLLRDPSLYVRKTTVAVVISFSENSSVFFLLDALNDEEESIRTMVFKVLNNMTGKDFGYHAAAVQNKRLEAIVAWKKWWRKHEHSFKFHPSGPAAKESKPADQPESPEKAVKAAEEPEPVPIAAAGPLKKPDAGPEREKPKADKESWRAGKKMPVPQALPEGSLEQKMYMILLQKQAKGMTIQDMGSSLNLPWQRLIQKTGLLQKSGWIYKDQDHHLFFPVKQ